ncbi:MAG: 50S ribosomal protein L7/L12 [Planctomycetes bacterium]|nr:50S ribosomal protein L7/L12 [Planctomycetota bacterium]
MSVAELLEKVNGLNADERTELFISAAENMKLLEVVGLVKAMEEKWDVKASGGGGGMMMMAPAAGGGDDEAEKTDFDVVLKEAGDKKIGVIKVVRELTGLNLKDAKAMVDGAPKTIKEKLPKEEAEKAKAQLEEAGAVVELK